jgi:methionine synthase II (cobalamin-independent)
MNDIKVRKEHRKILKDYSERINAIKLAQSELAYSSLKSHEKLWDAIKYFYPETKKGAWSYNHHDQKITYLHEGEE